VSKPERPEEKFPKIDAEIKARGKPVENEFNFPPVKIDEIEWKGKGDLPIWRITQNRTWLTQPDKPRRERRKK
jgi:hypothetical protein